MIILLTTTILNIQLERKFLHQVIEKPPPPCTSMAGTQRRSLPRQTKLIEFEFKPRHVWSSTKQPNTLKATLPTKQYCENVSKLQLYGKWVL